MTLNLRRAMANLIAVVLATPHQSTHLWYHMFKPEELSGTYMTGFMMVSVLSCWYQPCIRFILGHYQSRILG